ncbi:uncharacterized protein LOC129613119 [Condylostylus longicornis]|uniref:uncharacterized protein LOC129613119 n=1 Tax=Condylostylus longicornis TaxID=2530218 RepID=UPI00244DB901|nr:uncharacterized protein LOC129613119 [Condylostylus longicornis]
MLLEKRLNFDYHQIFDPNEFGYCIRDANPGKSSSNIKECVGHQMLNFLQNIEDAENFTLIKGLKIVKDEKAERSVANVLDQDPVDFRGILENAGVIISNRALQWDLNGIYPGLQLRIGPSADTTSVLEFALDPQVESNERNYLAEEPSTARILTKKLLLPFLLGLKFNLVAIVPLLFAGIIFLCQKAAILAKLALFLSSIFGIGGALGLGALGSTTVDHGFGGFSGINGYGFAGPPAGLHHHLKPHGFSSGLSAYSADTNDYEGYVRNDRRVKFDQPREFQDEVEKFKSSVTTPTPDRFYDYEKNVLLQDRQFKMFERQQQQQQQTQHYKGVSNTETVNLKKSNNQNKFVWKAL